MSVNFQPHYGDVDQRIRRIERELTRRPTVGASVAVAAPTTGDFLGSQIPEAQVVFDDPGGHDHTASGTAVPLAGDVTGTNRATVVASAANGFAVTGTETVTLTDAAVSTPATVLTVSHRSSGVALAGLGTEVHLDTQGPGGGPITVGVVRALYAGGAAGVENSTFIWGCLKGGVEAEVVRFRGTLGSAVSGGVGGQFWCRTEALFSGTTLGFFNTTPITQRAAFSLTGTPVRVFPTDPSTSYVGQDNTQPGSVYAKVVDLNALRGVVSTLLGVVNQLAADLGATAGFGLNAT